MQYECNGSLKISTFSPGLIQNVLKSEHKNLWRKCFFFNGYSASKCQDQEFQASTDT